MPVKIFICYAHEDEALLNKLKAHLKPLQHQGLIDVWYDRDISAGTEWKREISQHLNEANIILLLVSPDFIKSDYCYSVEMRRAIERHKQREASVIPIILRWVSWMGTPLGTLQAFPKDGKPIKSWQDEDEAFYDVIKGIRKIQASHEDEQRESELSLPQYKPSAPPPVIQKRSLHSTWKKSVLFLLVLLVIVSVVLFSTSYFSNLNYQKRTNSTVTTQTLLTRTALDTVSPSTSPTATPTLCLVRCVLYHADWSKGLVGWMGGSQWSVNSNGILVSNGNDQNIKFLLAPYQPK